MKPCYLRFTISGQEKWQPSAFDRDSKSRLLFRSTFPVLRQLIGQSDPIELAARMYVVLGREPVWGVEATSRNVDFVQEVFVLESQLRAALWTETPRALSSRSKPGKLTADESEMGSRHAEPRDERRARGSTTDRTVAVCFVKGIACCLITDPSAKASSLEH
jgi:hypothetical protein